MSEAGRVWIGESFIGEAAPVNVVLGDDRGPVGTAWANPQVPDPAARAPGP